MTDLDTAEVIIFGANGDKLVIEPEGEGLVRLTIRGRNNGLRGRIVIQSRNLADLRVGLRDVEKTVAPRLRAAIVRTDSIRTVAQYLPGNYSAVATGVDKDGPWVRVEGKDNAGWTLDDYVIPRLASGLLYAREVTGE